MTLHLFPLAALLVALGGGDREEGLAHYRAGRFAAAQAAFARALAAAPGDVDLQWNLALAAWRAGDLATAETAAAKYAAATGDDAEHRHRGLLGAVRYAEAEELERRYDAASAPSSAVAPPGQGGAPSVNPVQLLEQAVEKALQAKDHFVSAVRAAPSEQAVRNGERAIRKLNQLKEKLEELEQQGSSEPQKDGQDSEPGDKGEEQQGEPSQQSGESEPGEQEQPAGEGEQEQPPPDSESEGERAPQPGEGEAPETPEPQPEPQAGEEQGASEPKPGEEQAQDASAPEPEPGQEEPAEGEAMEAPEPEPVEPRNDAPGEGGDGRELTPEQAKRVMDRLKQLEKQLQQAKVRARAGRKPVERDW